MEKGSSLAIPAAIVVAGVIVAGSIYFSNINRPTTITADTVSQDTTVRYADISINPVSDKDYIRGNPNAKVVVVEYSDTECPFCKRFHSTMKSLADTYGKDGTVAWVYRNFPIEQLHARAQKEAEALLCAGKLGGTNGFWNYTDRVYTVTQSNDSLEPSQLPQIAKDVGLNVTAFNTCLSSGEMAARVKADYDDGVKAGGSGTPFSVFITQKEFDSKEMEEFLVEQMLKYGFPADLFAISNDHKRVSGSGAMTLEFMEALMKEMAS